MLELQEQLCRKTQVLQTSFGILYSRQFSYGTIITFTFVEINLVSRWHTKIQNITRFSGLVEYSESKEI